MVIVLGIGDYAISNRTSDVIKTYALGSCVAMVVYHPVKQILAMTHIALPDSTVDPEMAKRCPGYYADTAVKALIHALQKDFTCPQCGFYVRLYGGAEAARKSDLFKIGERNLQAIEQACDTHGLRYRRMETGGTWSRTIEADVATGTVEMHSYPFRY